MREHGGFENFAMIEIEKYVCENSRQLEAREEHWRKELGATLNGQQSFTTPEERQIQVIDYWNANKEKILLQQKEYQHANKEKIKKQKHDYYIRKKLEKLNLQKTI